MTYVVGDPGHTDHHNGLDTRAPLTPEMFGAVGDGTTDDQTALAAALAALSTGQTLLLKAGNVYAHSGVLTVATNGVTVSGGGTIKSTVPATSSIKVTADNVTFDGFTVSAANVVTRLGTENDYQIYVTGDYFTARDLILGGGTSASLLIGGGAYFLVDNCRATGGEADGFHVTEGAHDGIIRNCVSDATGDDGFAAVAYAADSTQVDSILFEGNRVVNGAARGLACVGATNVTFRDCVVDTVDGAGVYVAAETSYSTDVPAHVRVERVKVTGSAQVTAGHAAFMVTNDINAADIADVTFVDCESWDPDNSSTGGHYRTETSGGGTVSDIRFDRCRAGNTTGTCTYYYTGDTPDLKDITIGPDTAASGWRLLATAKATAGGTASLSSGTFETEDFLMVVVRQNGLSGAANIGIQFNGDTSTNYRHRHLYAASGGTTLTNVEATGQTAALIAGTAESAVRVITVLLSNEATWQKSGICSSAAYVGDTCLNGQVGWSNTSDQISSVTVTPTASATFNAGAQLLVFGRSAE